MILQVIFILYLHYICRALSLQCRSCDQKLDLTVSDINTNISECKFVDAPYASCSQRLHIRYVKNETSVVLRASAEEPLVLTNEAQIMINTTLIWLTKFQLERIFQIDCFDSTQCEKDTINHTYAEVRLFQYTELWGNLLIRLYDAFSKPAELVCADDQNEAVPCPHGFCQLISSNFLTFSRGCIPKGVIDNSYGVMLESKTMPGQGIKSSITYTCNKPMCNNVAMAKEVQHLLETRELMMSITTTTTTTTMITSTSTPSSSVMTKPILYIHYTLALLMAMIFYK
ncbi:unnamed protein product [Adineta steineri]|uniref:Uncharacterized protein n=1 Tax=Adineta steineri TaxID=433720 RepID=A0A815LAT9_9BILA|nr:unnamed protein product [Adineta steineri]CAF1616441.1 unnamed protein product [Adineta steineri]